MFRKTRCTSRLATGLIAGLAALALVGCTQSPEENKATESAALYSATSSCDSNYTGCVPSVDYDLDCPDVGRSVRVLGVDVHRFDADGDGYGCESYE